MQAYVCIYVCKPVNISPLIRHSFDNMVKSNMNYL